MSPSRLLAALALILLPVAGHAQMPRIKVALDLNSNQSVRGEADAAQSVKRRVAVSLTAALESAGYEVMRVKDSHAARRSGRYEAVLRVNVEARPVYLATDAHVHDKNQAPSPLPYPAQDKRKHVHAELRQSVETWANWTVWDSEINKLTGRGEIAPRMAAIEGSGDSASLEDEENLARMLSDELAQAILPAIDIALTPREPN